MKEGDFVGAADFLSGKNITIEDKYSLLDLRKLHLTPWQQETMFWENSQGHRDLSFTWGRIKIEGFNSFGEPTNTKTDDVFIHVKGFEDLLNNLTKYDLSGFISRSDFSYGFWLVELTATDANQNEVKCTLYKGDAITKCPISLNHPLVLESFLEGKDYHPYALDALINDRSDCSYRRFRNGINAYPGISTEMNIGSIRYTLSAFGVTERLNGSKIISYRNYLKLPVGCIMNVDMGSLDIEVKDTIAYARSVLMSQAVQNLTSEKLKLIEQHWNDYKEIINERYYPYVNMYYDKDIVSEFDYYFKSRKVFDRLEELPNLPLRYFIVLFNPVIVESVL